MSMLYATPHWSDNKCSELGYFVCCWIFRGCWFFIHLGDV